MQFSVQGLSSWLLQLWRANKSWEKEKIQKFTKSGVKPSKMHISTLMCRYDSQARKLSTHVTRHNYMLQAFLDKIYG
jgi:hypothetical protein